MIIIIHGYTATGKTTLLNYIAESLKKDHNIYTLIGDNIRNAFKPSYYDWFDENKDDIIYRILTGAANQIHEEDKNAVVLLEDYNYVESKQYKKLKGDILFIALQIPKHIAMLKLLKRIEYLPEHEKARWIKTLLNQNIKTKPEQFNQHIIIKSTIMDKDNIIGKIKDMLEAGK
jgi:tRNA uridine 5-carbamoylmethylation protein Kti12